MKHFATTRNAVPMPAEAIPLISIESFRREVLSTIGDGRRLLLLAGISQDGGGTRLLAALADARLAAGI